MAQSTKFFDGLTSFINQLANRRDPAKTNQVTASTVSDSELKAIYRTGLGSKIVRLKTGYALTDTIQFRDSDQEKFYNLRLKRAVKKAASFQLAFGRGIIVIQEPNGDLAQPLFASTDISKAQLKVFSGDMITVTEVERDLSERRYLKPIFYNVRGHQVHYSRVIDFTYVEPVELDAPLYNYGGISEFELVHTQLVNDAIVERASAFILERNSTMFYKVKDFKQVLARGKENDLLTYFSRLEDARSIYGAGIVDAEDNIEVHAQSLTNLSEADQITLRRLAMVTGISFVDLVGEGASGLNATGADEERATSRMVKYYQDEFLIDPINHLMLKFGQQPVKFKENQEPSAKQKADYEATVLDNALKLAALGEDHAAYLNEKGFNVEEDIFSKIFTVEEAEQVEPVSQEENAATPDNTN